MAQWKWQKILQTGILEGVAMLPAKEASQPGDQTCISYTLALAGRFFTTGTTWEASVGLQSSLLRIAPLQIIF